jgi:hypothetical protein
LAAHSRQLFLRYEKSFYQFVKYYLLLMFQNKVSVAFFPETNAPCRTLDENELEQRLKKIFKGELEPDDETAVNLLLQQIALANKLPGSSFDLIDQFLRRYHKTIITMLKVTLID